MYKSYVLFCPVFFYYAHSAEVLYLPIFNFLRLIFVKCYSLFANRILLSILMQYYLTVQMCRLLFTMS